MLRATMLASTFKSAVSASCAANYEDTEELDALLVSAIGDARSQWADVQLSDEQFTKSLARAAEANGSCKRFWKNACDLYLASACAREDRRAIELFEAQYLEGLESVLKRVTANPDEIAEVKQVLVARLLVAQAGDAPRIASYNGRGPLRSWLRAAAVREAIALHRHQRRHTVFEPDELLPATLDVELDHFRELYTLEFKTALQEAFSELTARERNVLRQTTLDGLSVGQVAKLHGVHRGSASRWLSEIRSTLAAQTKKKLGKTLQVSADELSSIMRLVDSRVDISLSRILQAETL